MSLNAPIEATIIQPAGISETQSLHFGRFVTPESATQVTVNTDGTIASTSAIHLGQARAGNFAVTGEPGYTVSVILGSPPFTLTANATDSMTLSSLSQDWPNNQCTLNSQGACTLHVGGTLDVAANQAPGDYSGSYTLEVDYV